MSEDRQQFDAAITEIGRASVEVLLRKHDDYGPHNIAGCPAGPLTGLVVRMHDKLARIAHLIETGADPSNESLADSFLDLANYGIIGQAVLRGDWPGAEGARR